MGVPESRSSRPVPTRLRVLVALLVLGAGGVAWCYRPRPARRDPDVSLVRRVPVSSVYKNTDPGVAYVGDAACARCHAEITSAFRAHPMGRSAAPAAGVMPGVTGPVVETGEALYSIERRGGRVFHREARKDESGRVVEAEEAEVLYAIGSGTRGFSFVVERSGGLFQSPIAWYTQEARWDLAPGYHRRNQHFEKPILRDCLFCHTNRFDRVEGRPPVFHGLAIGCERCHGPGELHVQNPGAVDGPDRTIVNPADLEPPAVRDSVCEQCHLQGSERVPQNFLMATDYRPGLPFASFVYVSYSRAEQGRRDRAVGHVEQMRASLCYRASGGALGCISCHDPHRLPGPAERVAYYRDRCLGCHADRGCTVPAADRRARSGGDDCASCHMPRAPVFDVGHTALTDHALTRPAAPAAPGRPPGAGTR